MERSIECEICVFLEMASRLASICSHYSLFLGLSICIYVLMHLMAERERQVYLSMIKPYKNETIRKYLLTTLQLRA